MVENAASSRKARPAVPVKIAGHWKPHFYWKVFGREIQWEEWTSSLANDQLICSWMYAVNSYRKIAPGGTSRTGNGSKRGGGCRENPETSYDQIAFSRTSLVIVTVIFLKSCIGVGESWPIRLSLPIFVIGRSALRARHLHRMQRVFSRWLLGSSLQMSDGLSKTAINLAWRCN